jgi:hypothetical protein
MKKVCLFVLLVLAVVLILPGSGKAGTLENGKNDRKGFFIGFGLGGGGINASGSGISRTRAAFISDVKIGGGITDKILLMYNGVYDYTRIEGVNFNVYQFPIAVQIYVLKDWYIRPGFGLALTTASTSVGGFNVSTGKISYGGSFGTGYEFRFGKYFSLSPEVVYHYNRIRSDISNGNLNAFGAQASLVWFF